MTLWGQCEWCGAEGVALRFKPGGDPQGRPSICQGCRDRAEAREREMRERPVPEHVAPVREGTDDG